MCKPVAASSNLTVSQREADLHEKMSNLQIMCHDRFIQEDVENHLKELCGLDKKVLIQNQRVKWSHKFVLARISKDRLIYNLAGFCQIMRYEESLQTRGHMLDYLITLLDDSNDFSWQAVKASHAVLLCRMKQGEIASWAVSCISLLA